jgi:hypothetical protein
MKKWPCFLFPLLVMACRAPQIGPRPEVTAVIQVPATVASPSPIYLDLQVPADVDNADALRSDLQSALLSEMKELDLRLLETPTPKDRSVLRVKINKYKARPARSPFLPWGLPGAGSAAAGFSLMAANDFHFLAILFGGAFVGPGIAFITLGSIKGGKKIRLDHERGYSLHAFRAEAKLEHLLNGKVGHWDQRYRSYDLDPLARPMSAEELKDPAAIRREMARAFSVAIRVDLTKELND